MLNIKQIWKVYFLSCSFQHTLSRNNFFFLSSFLSVFLSRKCKWGIVKVQYLPTTNSSANSPPCINSEATVGGWHCKKTEAGLLPRFFVCNSHTEVVEVHTLASSHIYRMEKLLQVFCLCSHFSYHWSKMEVLSNSTDKNMNSLQNIGLFFFDYILN